MAGLVIMIVVVVFIIVVMVVILMIIFSPSLILVVIQSLVLALTPTLVLILAPTLIWVLIVIEPLIWVLIVIEPLIWVLVVIESLIWILVVIEPLILIVRIVVRILIIKTLILSPSIIWSLIIEAIALSKSLIHFNDMFDQNKVIYLDNESDQNIIFIQLDICSNNNDLDKTLQKNINYWVGDIQQKMRKPKNFAEFTHFASIPFIRAEHRSTLGHFQDRIEQIFKQQNLAYTLNRSNTNLMHITLSMLTLNLQEYREKTKGILNHLQKQISQTLKGAVFTLGDIKYFTRFNPKDKKSTVSLFYFDFLKDQNMDKLEKVTDLLIREMIKQQVIDPNQLKSMHICYDHKSGRYLNDQYHMTLFRIQEVNEDEKFKQIFQRIQQIKNQKQDLSYKLECDFVDVSTRFHFDQTSFYEPLARVKL